MCETIGHTCACAAVSVILSNPPPAKFFAGASLSMSAAPISQMLLTDDTGTEEPSTAYKRTYSSASESSSVFSPSSSVTSTQYGKAFGREVSRESIDSTYSQFENQTTVWSDTDPEASFKSRNSSASSDCDPSPVNLIPGVMPRKDFASGGGGGVLFTVPEGHASSGKVYLRLYHICTTAFMLCMVMPSLYYLLQR